MHIIIFFTDESKFELFAGKKVFICWQQEECITKRQRSKLHVVVTIHFCSYINSKIFFKDLKNNCMVFVLIEFTS